MTKDEERRIPVRDKRVAATDDTGQTTTSEPVVEDASPATPDAAAELQKLADDRLDQLMRLKADFENFRKRELREKTELIERASLRIVEQLLPVLDDLDRALAAAKSEARDDALVRGVEIVQKKLHEVLVAEGLERVVSEGAFDPEHHEAVSSVPGSVDEPTVLEVVRPGYKLKGKTIRPALVNVSVPQARPETEKSAEAE